MSPPRVRIRPHLVSRPALLVRRAPCPANSCECGTAAHGRAIESMPSVSTEGGSVRKRALEGPRPFLKLPSSFGPPRPSRLKQPPRKPATRIFDCRRGASRAQAISWFCWWTTRGLPDPGASYHSSTNLDNEGPAQPSPVAKKGEEYMPSISARSSRPFGPPAHDAGRPRLFAILASDSFV